VPADGKEPALRGGSGRVLLPGAEGAEERFLDEVLGVRRGAAGQAEREAVDGVELWQRLGLEGAEPVHDHPSARSSAVRAGTVPAGVCRVNGAASLVPRLEDLLVLRCHAGVPVPPRGLDAAAVGLLRFRVAPEAAQRVAEPAPGVALVVGQGEVFAELIDDELPAAQPLVFGGEAEAQPRVVRAPLEHLAERVDAWVLHDGSNLSGAAPRARVAAGGRCPLARPR